jgi:hypothetical protein
MWSKFKHYISSLLYFAELTIDSAIVDAVVVNKKGKKACIRQAIHARKNPKE